MNDDFLNVFFFFSHEGYILIKINLTTLENTKSIFSACFGVLNSFPNLSYSPDKSDVVNRTKKGVRKGDKNSSC